MCLTSSLATEALILPSPPSLLFLLERNCPWDEMMSFERDDMQSEYDLHYPILIPLSFSDFAGWGQGPLGWKTSKENSGPTEVGWVTPQEAPSWVSHFQCHSRVDTELLKPKQNWDLKLSFSSQRSPNRKSVFGCQLNCSHRHGLCSHSLVALRPLTPQPGAVYHQQLLNPVQRRLGARCNSEFRGRGE